MARRAGLARGMTFAFPSLLEFGLEPAALILTRGFSDYFVPIQSSPAVLAHMARVDGVDFATSRVAVLDGRAVGVALIARRGWTSRLAGMAIVPEARRHGVGRALMAQLLDEARARQERAMVLEVIEQNAPAVHLYERCGFQKIRRLTGHAGRPATPPADEAPPPPVEIDPRELAAFVSGHGLRDLPWQIAPEAIAHAGPPALAYRAGPSAVLITDPAAPTIGIRALVTATEARGQGHSRALLRALFSRLPGKEWRASAIFPAEMGGAFTAAGLERTPLSQWQMILPLV